MHRGVHAAGGFGFEPGALEYHLSHFIDRLRTPIAQPSIRRPKHQTPVAAPCGKRTDGRTGRDSIMRQVTAARGLWGWRWALTDLTYGSLEQTLIIPPVRDGYRRRFSEADKRHIVVATLYWQHVGRTRRKFFDVHDEEANSGPSLRLCKAQ